MGVWCSNVCVSLRMFSVKGWRGQAFTHGVMSVQGDDMDPAEDFTYLSLWETLNTSQQMMELNVLSMTGR